ASVGHELFPLPEGRGTTLGATEAILLVQDELRLLAARGAPADPSPAVPPGPAASPTVAAPGSPAARGVLRPVGDSWEVGLDDHVVTMRATKGLADPARLLARPERAAHCLERIRGVAESHTGP